MTNPTAVAAVVEIPETRVLRTHVDLRRTSSRRVVLGCRNERSLRVTCRVHHHTRPAVTFLRLSAAVHAEHQLQAFAALLAKTLALARPLAY
jgi:hypothetical protein